MARVNIFTVFIFSTVATAVSLYSLHSTVLQVLLEHLRVRIFVLAVKYSVESSFKFQVYTTKLHSLITLLKRFADRIEEVED